jgi:hypothetical protein
VLGDGDGFERRPGVRGGRYPHLDRRTFVGRIPDTWPATEFLAGNGDDRRPSGFNIG